MARCTTCGRRVHWQRTACPLDGTAVASLPAACEPSALPQVPGFRIDRVLGLGGFATVYAARDDEEGGERALKVSRADVVGATEQLLQEIEALRAIGPPHVPCLHRAGFLADGAAYAALELIGSPTLGEAMVSQKLPLELAAFAGCAEAILAAVEAVHQRGFVHCDLKPENIFLLESPLRVRLIDFGLARAVEESPAGDSTGSGPAPGSADYMSPEQCRNSAKVGIAADIYALGVIFFEMLTGRVPFFGKPADVLEAHRSRRPPRLGDIRPEAIALEEVIRRCLSKNPADRFSSAVSVRIALLDALNASSRKTPNKPERAPPAPQPTRAREKQSVALLFFNTREDAARIKSALSAHGGLLAHAAVSAHAGVFSLESGDNPVNRAVGAARALIDAGFCERAKVDVGTVSVHPHAAGRRYFSPFFAQADRYPWPEDPPGILVGEEAAKVLKDVPGSWLERYRPGVFRLAHPEKLNESSVVEFESAGPIIGREEVLESLLGAARGAVDSRSPTISTVIAEPGHGKTRLCRALLEQLPTVAGARLIHFRAREPSAGEADQTIRELLRTLFGIEGVAGPDPGRRLLADRLGPALASDVWPGAALALGWLSLESEELKPFAAAPGALRSGAARAAGAAMRRLAEKSPLLLVLDDAQFADDATLDAIEYATLSEARSPIWACVFARPSFQAGRPGWAERSAQQCRVELEPLAQEAAADLCRTLLSPAENVPAAAIQLLVERTKGIPIQIVELVRALKDGGMVRQNARTGTWYLATDELGAPADLPLVEWLAGKELGALPADLASHARLAALLGDDFVPEEISGVLAELERAGTAGSFPLDAAVATKQLLRKGVLVERRRDQLSFRHALVRDAMFQSVPEAVRRPIHQAAFLYYSGECLLPPRQRLARLAFHAAQSGLAGVAADSYLRLAEQAQSRHAYVEAESMYSRALEQMLAVPNPQRLSALRGRALMRYRLSRYEDASKDFELAREIAHHLGELESEIEILLDEATALDWADEYRRSKELVDVAELLARNCETPLLEAKLLMGLGRSCVRFNTHERAAELYGLAAQRAGELGDAGYETYVISLLHNGYVLASLGRLEESERAFDRVIPLCEQRGDKLHLGAALGNRITLWTCRNDEHRLMADLYRLLQICREMGNGRMEQQAHFYLGLYLRYLGELEDAEKHARRAVEIDEKRLGEAARPESSLLLARVFAAAGNTAGARYILRQIQGRRRGALGRRDQEIELLPGEEVFFSLVDLATREASGEEWEALWARAVKCLTGQDQIEFWELRGRGAQRRAADQEAIRAFQQAVLLAGRVPNVMLNRLQAELSSLSNASPH